MDKRFWKKVLQLTPYILIAAIAVATMLCCRFVVTDGPSMQPTYTPGDKLLCVRYFGQPQTGDVVIIKKDGVLMAKRIRAVAGESVIVKDPDGQPQTYSYWSDSGEATVPEGYVFVAGDNYTNSYDSRYEEFGLVKLTDIWGHVAIKF